MSLYYKVNDENTTIYDVRKTNIMIDSRNHINPLDTTVHSSTQHFDNLSVNIEPINDVISIEVKYYHLRFYDVGTAYTNPYVNLYLSNYGKIVNNYDGQNNTYNTQSGTFDRPFAILPLETSIVYPAGTTIARAPFNVSDKLNYEQFPSDTAMQYSATNTICPNFKMITEYPTPIDRISRINVSLKDFQGRYLSETTQARAAGDTSKMTSKAY